MLFSYVVLVLQFADAEKLMARDGSKGRCGSGNLRVDETAFCASFTLANTISPCELRALCVRYRFFSLIHDCDYHHSTSSRSNGPDLGELPRVVTPA